MTIKLKGAVDNFRKQWNWIADETLRQKRKVTKKEYFAAQGVTWFDIPPCMCYLCAYTKTCRVGDDQCDKCPIEWGGKISNCCHNNFEGDYRSLYARWEYTTDYIAAANLAREIANLPLKEQYQEEYKNAID